MTTADYLIETADRCSQLAKTGRRLVDELDAVAGPQMNEHCVRIATAGREALQELDAICQSLLAKAVELDTRRQKGASGC